MSGWISDVKRFRPEQVFPMLGLHPLGGRFSPCPSCGREQASTSDKRGPVRTRGDYAYCARCGSLGSTVDLVAWCLLGQPYNHDDERHRREVRAWAATQAMCEGEGYAPTVAPRKTAPPPVEKRRHPDPAEVRQVWATAQQITIGADGCSIPDLELQRWIWDRWARRKGQSPEQWQDNLQLVAYVFAQWGLLRVVRKGAPLPWWASFRSSNGEPDRPYSTGPWRAALPMYDARGNLVSLRFRSVRGTTSLGSALGAKGVNHAVFACPLAQHIMRHGKAPDWYGHAPLRLVVAEGGPDFLTWCLQQYSTPPERRYAVVGVVSGSWTAEHALWVPVGSQVAVWTHNDDGGDGYAEQIRRTLRPRGCRILRALPRPGVPDA